MNAPTAPRPVRLRPAPIARALHGALLCGAVVLAGCGDEASAPAGSAGTDAAKARAAKDAAAEGMAIVATYPVRYVYVAFQPPPRAGVASPRRTEAEALVRAREAVARLRARDASFSQVAREMSDDPSTASEEGFVGFVGRMTGHDERLVAKVAALAVGTISEPIPSRGGYHVAQRLSREEGKALEARLFVPFEGLLIPSTAQMRGLPDTQTPEWARVEAARAIGPLREGTATLEKLAEPISGSKVLRDVLRGSPAPGQEDLVKAMRAAEPGEWVGPIDVKEGVVVARRLPYVRASACQLIVTHLGSARSRRVTPRVVEEAERIATEARARILADPSSWDRVVAEVSEEPGTKDAGGFMGDLANTTPHGRGNPPEIEQAVWKLAPGEISDVVASRFGFHVFRRID